MAHVFEFLFRSIRTSPELRRVAVVVYGEPASVAPVFLTDSVRFDSSDTSSNLNAPEFDGYYTMMNEKPKWSFVSMFMRNKVPRPIQVVYNKKDRKYQLVVDGMGKFDVSYTKTNSFLDASFLRQQMRMNNPEMVYQHLGDRYFDFVDCIVHKELEPSKYVAPKREDSWGKPYSVVHPVRADYARDDFGNQEFM